MITPRSNSTRPVGRPSAAGTGYDAELLERSGADEVLVLPTAAAYEQPDRVVAVLDRRGIPTTR